MAWSSVEAQRLMFIRSHQQQLRADLYCHLMDNPHSSVSEGGKLGVRRILPPSFEGSPRDRNRRLGLFQFNYLVTYCFFPNKYGLGILMD